MVAGSGHGAQASAPASKARTTGAHPAACTLYIRGRAAAGIQPACLSSANAFHMPINPVPPPVGYTIASGSVQSSCSASSRPSVFFPSMRYGSRSVDTSTAPVSVAYARAALPQSPMWPSTHTSSAPKPRIWARMRGGVLAGAYTRARRPARVAYAASATPAFPAVGTTRDCAPPYAARVTAAASPRALNEPVGFDPSSFTRRSRKPCFAARRGTVSKGVPPSPRVTGASPSASGSHSR